MATAVPLALRLDTVERASVADLTQLLGLQRLELAQRAQLPHARGWWRGSAQTLSADAGQSHGRVCVRGKAAKHTSASRRGSISLQATRIATSGAGNTGYFMCIDEEANRR